MLHGPNHWPGVGVLWRSVAAWYRRDALYRELSALDERGLKDIGITRSDIPAVVEGRLWRGGECGDGVDNVERLEGRSSDHPVGCADTPP